LKAETDGSTEGLCCPWTKFNSHVGLCERVQHCSTPTNEPEVLETAVETAEEPEVTDAQLDSDKQLIYQ